MEQIKAQSTTPKFYRGSLNIDCILSRLVYLFIEDLSSSWRTSMVNYKSESRV